MFEAILVAAAYGVFYIWAITHRDRKRERMRRERQARSRQENNNQSNE